MNRVWDSVLSEPDLMERYGLTERQLQTLRANGLPYIRISVTTRLYEEAATLDYLAGLLRTSEPRPRRRKEASNE